MGRGRPKGSKNKTKVISNDLFVNTNFKDEKPTLISQETDTSSKNLEADNIITTPEETKQKLPQKTPKILGYCDKCHKPVYSSFITANLSHLTGKAIWHRDCNLERVNLCKDCGAELNSIIDNWILKDNPQYKKFS